MAVAVTDYNQVLTDLQTLITAQVTDFDRVSIEELDVNSVKSLKSHKRCDIQLMDSADHVRAGNEYVADILVHLVISAYDLSSFKDAATLRNDLVRQAKVAVRSNPRFSGDIESTVTGRTTFADDQVERGFIALAVVELTISVYEGG